LQVWSFGIRLKDTKVSRKEFVHGYTHIIKREEPRQQLSTTLEELLGGCFDIFDDTMHGQRTGKMSKEEFVSYQVRSQDEPSPGPVGMCENQRIGRRSHRNFVR
jgi:hypothetical protein